MTNFLNAFSTLEEDIKKHDLQSQLPTIVLPSLLIYGKYDFGTSPDVGTMFLNEISSSKKQLSVYANSGHEAMLTEPEKFNEEIINFIESNK